MHTCENLLTGIPLGNPDRNEHPNLKFSIYILVYVDTITYTYVHT